MARLREIVFDTDHPAALARFWAAVLDGYSVRAYDGQEVARLLSLGCTPETDPTVMVDGPGPLLCFQRRTNPTVERGRLHLDIVGEAREREVARIIELGGQVRHKHESHTVMLDPDGNAFCVQDPDS